MTDPAAAPTKRIADTLRRVLDAEAEAVRSVPVEPPTVAAVELLSGLPSHAVLHVGGVGKSGHVAAKLSATFASLGLASQLLNPVEAVHGDLGRVRPGDAALLLTRSGQTVEVVELAGHLKSAGVRVVGVCGFRPDPVPATHLAACCELVLEIGDPAEADADRLAPTCSSTAMLALGDALAVAVAEQRGFGAHDFHRVHPGGGLGRLLLPVVEVMRFRVGQNLPLLDQRLTLREAHAAAAAVASATPGLRRPGALLAVDDAGRLAGVFTDGDLRRLAFSGGEGPLERRLSEVVTRSPTVLPHTATVRDAVASMRATRLDELPVLDTDRRPVGLIDVQDLVGLRVW